MNTFQIVMLVGAGAMAISIFWSQISSLFSKVSKPAPSDHKHGTSELVEIVSCWESLRNNCVDAKLDKAVSGLDQIFPYLIQQTNKGKPDE